MCRFLPPNFYDFHKVINTVSRVLIAAVSICFAMKEDSAQTAVPSVEPYSVNWCLFPIGAVEVLESIPACIGSKTGIHSRQITRTLNIHFPLSLACVSATVGGKWRIWGERANTTQKGSTSPINPRASSLRKGWKNWIGEKDGLEVTAALYQFLDIIILDRRLQ